MDSPQVTKVFKVIVVGDSGVGKTAFVKTYVFEEPNLSNSGTVGVDFVVKTVDWKNTTKVKLQVWDIGGQDRSAFLLRVFCHRAHGCAVLFDVANPKTFDSVAQWKREVDDKCLTEGRKPIPCLLLANKCDLDDRMVRLKDIDQTVHECNFLAWKEISVKDQMNLNESMNILVDAMIQRSLDPLNGSPLIARRAANTLSMKKSPDTLIVLHEKTLLEKQGSFTGNDVATTKSKKKRACC